MHRIKYLNTYIVGMSKFSGMLHSQNFIDNKIYYTDPFECKPIYIGNQDK